MRLFVKISIFFFILTIGISAKVWNVNVNCLSDTITNGDSENIDVAFAYATAGDIINIDSGVYYYSVQNTIDTTSWYYLKIVDDNIRIVGNGDVVIDGEHQTFLVYGAYADSIYIENITFQNGYDYTEGASNQYGVAFDLYSGDSWTIVNNRFYNNVVYDSLTVGQEIRGGVIYIGRWSIFENNTFDSNAIYDYGYGDTITGLIYCDYQVDFVGNVFKNNLIWNKGEKQKSINGLVYYNRAFAQSFWYDNYFEGNRVFNVNALSGAVAFIYQENYQGITDAIYGDSNNAYDNYYFDKLTNNVDDTDILGILSKVKINSLAIDLFNNYPKSYVNIESVRIELFDNQRYSHNKVKWIALDMYDLLPYYPHYTPIEYMNRLLHNLMRRRFK